MSRIDSLDLQVDVIDSNVGELTSMAHEMNSSLHDVQPDVKMLNQILMAYFQSQNFFPTSFPPHDQGPHQWRFKKLWLDICACVIFFVFVLVLCLFYILCFVHVLCLKYLIHVMWYGCVNSFSFHLNCAKHKQWSWFEALSCMNSYFNMQIVEIRHVHAIFEHGRAC